MNNYLLAPPFRLVVQMADFPQSLISFARSVFPILEIGSNPSVSGQHCSVPFLMTKGFRVFVVIKAQGRCLEWIRNSIGAAGSESVCDRDSSSPLNRAVQAQVEELVKLNQLKDDFLSTVSHELRIHGQHKNGYLCWRSASQTARWHNKTESVAIYKFARRICAEINLINDLLDLQR